MSDPRTGRRLIFQDGTTIENGEAGYADGSLWCYFTGTMQDAIRIFFDTGKTGRIEYQFGEEENVWEGFTQCMAIMTGEDGQMSVRLERA